MSDAEILAIIDIAIRTALGSEDALIAEAEVRSLLAGSSRKKIRGLVDRHEFNTYRYGGRTVYSRREVRAHIARTKAVGPGRAPFRGTRHQGVKR